MSVSMARCPSGEAKQALLSLVLDANKFALDCPTRVELRAIAKELRWEHSSLGSCDLTDGFDAFRTIDCVIAWMFDAYRRNEIWVLHETDESAADEARELLVRGMPHGRRMLPTFATVFKNTASPYIELLWVRRDVRRLRIGSLMVRSLCLKHPGIKRVKSVLATAQPFWNTMEEQQVVRIPRPMSASSAVVAPSLSPPPAAPIFATRAATPSVTNTAAEACGMMKSGLQARSEVRRSEAHAATRLQAAWRRKAHERASQRLRAGGAQEAVARTAACIRGLSRQRSDAQLVAEAQRRKAAETMQHSARHRTVVTTNQLLPAPLQLLHREPPALPGLPRVLQVVPSSVPARKLMVLTPVRPAPTPARARPRTTAATIRRHRARSKWWA